jgi:hypothetical protein
VNSFVLDWALRQRIGGSNLNWFVLEDLPVPVTAIAQRISGPAASLAMPSVCFASDWLRLPRFRQRAWRHWWAISACERLRQRSALEASIAFAYGLDETSLGNILADCDHPVEALQSNQFTRSLNPKGFWRFQKDRPPELRIAVLAQIAFGQLAEQGIDRFCEMNNGEGWMIPETLRLADYGLGHDDRSKEPQPVAAALGPRFYPWQLEQSVEDSWEECERHAGILGRLLPPPDEEEDAPENSNAVPVDLFGDPVETDLFGKSVYPKSRNR